MLGTKYVRHLGRRLFPVYTCNVDASTRIRLRVGGEDAWVAREIFDERPYERYFNPSKKEIVVDAGANIGCFTIRAARLVGKAGRVIALEPSSTNYELLRSNVEANRLANVNTMRIGLGETERESDLFIYNR